MRFLSKVLEQMPFTKDRKSIAKETEYIFLNHESTAAAAAATNQDESKQVTFSHSHNSDLVQSGFGDSSILEDYNYNVSRLE